MKEKLSPIYELVDSIRMSSRSSFAGFLSDAVDEAAGDAKLPRGFKVKLAKQFEELSMKRAFVALHDRSSAKLDKICNLLNVIEHDLTSLSAVNDSRLPSGVAEFLKDLGLDADSVKCLDDDSFLAALAGIHRKSAPLARLEAYLRLCVALLFAYTTLANKIAKLEERRHADKGAEGSVAANMVKRLEATKEVVWARLAVAAKLFFAQRRRVLKMLVVYTAAFKDKWPSFPSATVAGIVSNPEISIETPLRLLIEDERLFATLPAKMTNAARKAAK